MRWSPLLVSLVAGCCFTPGEARENADVQIFSSRDVPLGTHGSLRVVSAARHSYLAEGSHAGFGCFGAPYPSCRWEPAMERRDMYAAMLAVAPGSQNGPVDAARLTSVAWPLSGSADDLPGAEALDAHMDVVACADESGRFAVVWGLYDGAAGSEITFLGLEPGSTLARTFDLADTEAAAPLPPEVAAGEPAAQCAWFVAHRDLYLALP